MGAPRLWTWSARTRHPTPRLCRSGVPSISVLEFACFDTAFDIGRFILPLALLHALA